MRSIKPGRGPSLMGGVAAVFAVAFGIIWTALTIGMGAPGLFPLFGVVFILFGIAQAVYNFKNATSKNRFSAFDITSHGEEEDPLNRRFGGDGEDSTEGRADTDRAQTGSTYSPCNVEWDRGAERDPFDPRNEKRRGGLLKKKGPGISASDFFRQQKSREKSAIYCPYCGAALDTDFIYCPKCGRQQP